MKKRKKRAMTLLEIMIVIFIIGIIGSVIGYNMRGSMDQGKAFKTRESITKLYNIIHLEMGSDDIQVLESTTIPQVVATVLKNSGLIAKPAQYMQDGWNVPFVFKVENVEGGYEIRITSEKYENFCKQKGKDYDYPWVDPQTGPNPP